MQGVPAPCRLSFTFYSATHLPKDVAISPTMQHVSDFVPSLPRLEVCTVADLRLPWKQKHNYEWVK